MWNDLLRLKKLLKVSSMRDCDLYKLDTQNIEIKVKL